jgi:AcrR family transcriptional regulator
MSADSSENQGKREQTKARNRAVILDAARAVFVEIGYDAATIRDIVARTDLAPGTFYNYFPDKQSVLTAITSEATAIGSRRIREARANATSLEELAYNGYRAYFEFIASDQMMFELLRRNISALRTLGIDATGFAAGVQELREDLERQMLAGRLPPLSMDYVPQILAAIAFEVGASMVKSDPPDVEGATRFAAELCLGGLERLARVALGAPFDIKAPTAQAEPAPEPVPKPSPSSAKGAAPKPKKPSR